jgi:quercetin dioxygenase-like cupin family protein
LLEALSAEELGRLELGRSVNGSGPVWGTETADLNVTLLEWGPGGGTPEHVNAERDVVVVVLAGSTTVTVDGEPRDLRPGEWLVLERGSPRRIAAGPEGVRYLSIHRRRAPLQVSRPARA